MTQVNVHEAKTSLSRLMKRAEAGEEIVIARDGKPSVKLVPVHTHAPKRINFGDLRDKIWISDDFHLPMSDAEVDEMMSDPAPAKPRRRRK